MLTFIVSEWLALNFNRTGKYFQPTDFHLKFWANYLCCGRLLCVALKWEKCRVLETRYSRLKTLVSEKSGVFFCLEKNNGWSFYMPAKSILTFWKQSNKHFRNIEALNCLNVWLLICKVLVSVGSESILGLIQQNMYVSDF